MCSNSVDGVASKDRVVEMLQEKINGLSLSDAPPSVDNVQIDYVRYQSEEQMPDIMALIQKDLSEPYSIYTYRYFIHNWPHLCFLVSCRAARSRLKALSYVTQTNLLSPLVSADCLQAMHDGKCVGAIVSKLDFHKKTVKRGYIAMLAVDQKYRKLKIGSNLVLRAIKTMAEDDADEVRDRVCLLAWKTN